MDFSVLIETGPDAPAMAKFAESYGFKTIFLIDSHIGWREVYPYLTLCARETSRIGVGTLVTNPITRHPTVTASAFATLQEISGGRMVLGIAKGDSSVRLLGERQATMAEFRRGARFIHQLANGQAIEYQPKHPGHEKWLAQSGGKTQKIHFDWYKPPKHLPMYIGGYGPKTLRFTGEAADAVVIQAPDVEIMRWSLGHVRDGAQAVGRDPREISVVVAGPAVVSSDIKRTRDALKWFVQAVWNHSAHLLELYDRSSLPSNLVAGVPPDFVSDYREHVREGAEELRQVPDTAVDALTVFGSAERCVARFHELAAAGAREFIVYALALPRMQIERELRDLAEQVIPQCQ